MSLLISAASYGEPLRARHVVGLGVEEDAILARIFGSKF
jgi:hypothetical protein